MFWPDIQTSWQSSRLVLGFDIQSLFFWIFQIPVLFRPISSLINAPSDRRYIDQWEESVMSLPITFVRISLSPNSLNCSCALDADAKTNVGSTTTIIGTRSTRQIMAGVHHKGVGRRAN